MRILAIETSFDETSVAIIESINGIVTLVSQNTATSIPLHEQSGGVIPEVAAREQIKYIIPVVDQTLKQADLSFKKDQAPDISVIAVTYGPGLIGSLLVGVETAKTLSYLWNKPLVPVNHLFGHIYANFISKISNFKIQNPKVEKEIPDQIRDDNLNAPQFPLIALIVSGAHTDLLLMKSHSEITWLGGTRDDAAGECFDKSGRLLGLSYPAGPEIEQKAKLGNPKAYHFPRPLLHDNAYDFSFSGLKTAILREVKKIQKKEEGEKMEEKKVNDICRGLQDAIIDVLVTKTLKAAEEYNVKSVLLSGGVAANTTLREKLQEMLDTKYKMLNTKLFVPPKSLCTDNAAMIGAAALFQGKKIPWQEVTANPELYFD